MNVYKCTDFEGFWPVGTAAVVVARDVVEAAEALEEKLRSVGLPQQIEPRMMTSVCTREPSVHILNDGDY